MALHNKIDMDKFEQDTYRELTRGNNTVALIAQSMKLANASVKWRLDTMTSEGKLAKKVVRQCSYYYRCILNAHDPFGLARKPNEHTRQSNVAHQ